MIRFLLLSFVAAFVSCSKTSEAPLTFERITYEVVSETSAPFSDVQFAFYRRDLNDVQMIQWGTVKGVGTFVSPQVDFIKDTIAAEMHAINPTSGDWKIRVKDSKGVIVKEVSPQLLNSSYQAYLSVKL